MFSALGGEFVGRYTSPMSITNAIEFNKSVSILALLQFCGRFGQA